MWKTVDPLRNCGSKLAVRTLHVAFLFLSALNIIHLVTNFPLQSFAFRGKLTYFEFLIFQ